MQYTDRRIWLGLLAALWLAPPSSGVPAVLTALSESDAQWQVRQPVTWQPEQTLAIQPEGWPLVVVSQFKAVLKTRLTDRTTASRLRLGEVRELEPVALSALPVAPVAPVTARIGTVVGLEDGQYVIQALEPPDVSRPGHLEAHPETVVRWMGPHGRNWLATAPIALPLGARVVYEPGVAEAKPTPVAVAYRMPDTLGEANVVPLDDPLYGRFAALAAAGCVPGTTQRHFRGDPEALYTRGQFADFLATMVGQLLDPQQIWPIQDCPSHLALHLQQLLVDFEFELAVRHVDTVGARAALAARHGLEGYAGMATGQATGRFQTGDDAAFGKLEGSYHGLYGDRFRFDVAAMTKSPEPWADEFDRDTLVTLHAAYDLSRHLTVGFGRLSTRFGPGQYDLLWSDRAQPMEQISIDYRSKVFGRPFRLTQHTGMFRQNGTRYLTVNRYEYGAADQVTLGLNFGLITDQSGQALASMVLPLYLARFTSGSLSAGGDGNFLGSADASWQVTREWQVYGQLFADDFDFTPGGVTRTAQRIGLLGGVYYTPRWGLPGTSYRLETALIPDRGTYIGQQDAGLAWRRDGYLLGHPYGEDSGGIRFDARHRITPRWDVSVRGEYIRQLRSFAVAPRLVRVDFGTWYDVNRWLTLGFGARHSDFADMGGIAGNDVRETTVFVESRAGL